jgi:phosphoribosylanthranilate isomerase
MSRVRIKVCGLTRAQDVAPLVTAGVAYAGLNFFPPSPRCLVPAQARTIALEVPPGMARVGLFVDPDDAALAAVLAEVPLDMIQLHGHETAERVAEVRGRFGLPVIQAVGVAGPEDLPALDLAMQAADMVLVDAKPPRGAVLPGGNGLTFDWRLIAGRRWPVPWLLAGGLTAANVAEAVRLTGAAQVDVASGVESAPGIKDAVRIAAFAAALA